MSRDRIIPGPAMIVPERRHLLMRHFGAQYLAEVVDGPLVNRHQPRFCRGRSVAAVGYSLELARASAEMQGKCD
jgi:chemotaxis response regulator CheB